MAIGEAGRQRRPASLLSGVPLLVASMLLTGCGGSSATPRPTAEPTSTPTLPAPPPTPVVSDQPALEPVRQNKAREALLLVSGTENLSADLRDIVERTLA